MDLITLNQKMYETTQRIDKATKSIYKLAENKAEAEYHYRIALRQEILKLKTEGYPVSIIYDIAKGNAAHLMFERDKSADVFKASIESLKALQSELNGLQSISKYQSEV